MKTTKKENTKYYYDLFHSLYNPMYMDIGCTWLQRINNKHYTWQTMKRMCLIMQWIDKNINTSTNSISFEGYKNTMGFIVRNQNKEPIGRVFFGNVNGKYIPIDYFKKEYNGEWIMSHDINNGITNLSFL